MRESPEVLHDDQSIWFHFPTWDYEIQWNRVQNQDALIAWIDHLAGKRWVTPDVIRLFIGTVQSHYGWERRSV